MANFTSNASDKSKKTALLIWAIGALGFLGLENFYVGKIKNGLIHVVLGAVGLMTVYAISETAGNMVIPLSVICWAFFGGPNFVKLLLGSFRDNVGAPLRR